VITHPYHPLHGQQFAVLNIRRTGGTDLLILREKAGGTFAVRRAWTDRAGPTPRDTLKKVPPFLYAPSLWTLVELLDSLSPQEDREGQS
jgi:hypothetical protein